MASSSHGVSRCQCGQSCPPRPIRGLMSQVPTKAGGLNVTRSTRDAIGICEPPQAAVCLSSQQASSHFPEPPSETIDNCCPHTKSQSIAVTHYAVAFAGHDIGETALYAKVKLEESHRLKPGGGGTSVKLFRLAQSRNPKVLRTWGGYKYRRENSGPPSEVDCAYRFYGFYRSYTPRWRPRRQRAKSCQKSKTLTDSGEVICTAWPK